MLLLGLRQCQNCKKMHTRALAHAVCTLLRAALQLLHRKRKTTCQKSLRQLFLSRSRAESQLPPLAHAMFVLWYELLLLLRAAAC
jgi:hypothetical protein